MTSLDTDVTTLSSVRVEIDRDRYGRPLIVPPDGGRKVPYTRATTLAGSIEDTFNLSRWQQRMVMIGLVDRPDLLLSAAAHRNDKSELNKIAEQAVEAAQAHAAATIGTALHALAERVDSGETIGPIPGEYRRDLDAYVDATRDLRVLASERFCVLDELRIGGTPDRVVEYQGRRFIADIKTGTLDWGQQKIAMQLAIYSRSVFYEPSSGQREPLPDVDQDRGIVIHLPAGTGTCRLLWTDLDQGWQAVSLAAAVRTWRTQRGLVYPFDNIDAAVANVAAAGMLDNPIEQRIAAASSEAALVAIWQEHQGEWTDAHTRAAAARKIELQEAQ